MRAARSESSTIAGSPAGCDRCRAQHESLSLLRRVRAWEPPRLSERARGRAHRVAVESEVEPARARSPRLWPRSAVGRALAFAALALWLARPAPQSRIL